MSVLRCLCSRWTCRVSGASVRLAGPDPFGGSVTAGQKCLLDSDIDGGGAGPPRLEAPSGVAVSAVEVGLAWNGHTEHGRSSRPPRSSERRGAAPVDRRGRRYGFGSSRSRRACRTRLGPAGPASEREAFDKTVRLTASLIDSAGGHLAPSCAFGGYERERHHRGRLRVRRCPFRGAGTSAWRRALSLHDLPQGARVGLQSVRGLCA